MVDMQRQLVDLTTQTFGGVPLTLRKQSDIRAAMQLAGAVLAGATEITADAAIKTKAGRMPKGAQFTIAGVAGSYTLTEAAESSGAAITLTFTPALPLGGAADNAVITWTQPYSDWTFAAIRSATAETSDKAIEKGVRVYQLAYKAGNEAPEVGDILDGLPVIKVEPVAPGGAVLRWRVTTGAKP